MEEIIQEALSKGVEMHVAGEFDLAGQLYESVLKLQPNHADANHNMGLLKLDMGNDLEALPYLQTALQLDTSIAQFWTSYIKALIKLERLDEAARILDLEKENGMESGEIVEFSQTLSENQNGLELACSKETQSNSSKTPNSVFVEAPEDTIDELIELYNQHKLELTINKAQFLTQKYPDAFIVWNILGAANKGLGRVDAAVAAFKRVTELIPTSPEGFNNLGVALKDQGKLDQAIASYNRALSLSPDYAEAYNNMGNALQNQGKLDQAIASYNKALSVKPNYAEAHYNMGNILHEQGDLDDAIASYNKALSFKTDYPEVYYNMGLILQEQEKLAEAIQAYEKGLSLKPDYAEPYNSLGLIRQENGKSAEAIEAFKKAVSLQPDYAEAHQNLSFALLYDGKITEGLGEYEWRWKNTKGSAIQRQFSIPVWDGQKKLQGKRILLWSEQGVGDTINWSSRLPLISSQAQHCTLECPEKLVPLLSRSFPNVEIKPVDKSRDAMRDDFDFHLPLGSLYRHFIPQILNNSKPDAFLIPDPARINFWKQRLKSLGPGPYIGVSWKSSDMSPKRLPNYAPISEWCPIFKIDGITYVNLQYVDYERDLAKIKSEFGVIVHNFDDLDHYNNLDDVAALCAALDMVVSTKITVPLISSGVGTITKLANWRQSPWNNILLNPVGPAIDIFEKNTWESWQNVFNEIAADIIKLKSKLNSTSESL